MYNKVTGVTAPRILDPIANGSIYFRDAFSGIVWVDVTTPWGYLESNTWFSEGECRLYTTPISYVSPTGYSIIGSFIVKVTNINDVSKTADFEALSCATTNVGSNLYITHNLPTVRKPGDVIDYTINVRNDNPATYQMRYVFASSPDGFPSLRVFSQSLCNNPLPPTTYHNNKCWYNDWITPPFDCQPRTIGSGATLTATGSLALSTVGTREYITLGIFIYVSNLWASGKNEWITPTSLPDGWLYEITFDPCFGKVCDPTYTCQGCEAYPLICNPTDPTGLCIPGTPPITNDPRCISEGYIYISSTPTGATISVDGYQIGTTGSTPVIVKTSVSGNPHRVELQLSGFEIWIDNNINISCTAPVVISPVLTPPAPYELRLQLGSDTTSTYVGQTLTRFVKIYTDALSIFLPGMVTINSVTYVGTTHEIVIEMQASALGTYSLQDPNIQYPNIQYPNIQSLLLPLWALLLIPAIPAIIAMILMWLGFDVPGWIFRKKETPINTNLQVNVCISLSVSTCADPTEPVTIEFNNETKIADTTNHFTVTFSNVKAVGSDTTYPIKAYIPVSAGSKVYKAGYGLPEFGGPPIILIAGQLNTIELKLKLGQSTQRDYTPSCPLKYPDNSNVPTGTKIRIVQVLKDAIGSTVIKEFGIRSVRPDGCIDPVKVPSYLTNELLDFQAISSDVSPNSPDPGLIRGDQSIIKRISDTKNKISIFTYSTVNNAITVDKIELKNLTTQSIIKTIVPTSVITDIDGISSGSYQVIVTKSGYELSSCTPSCETGLSCPDCQIIFTAEYLQTVSYTVILRSLVTTCDSAIYVLDKDGKALKTTPYVKMCKDSKCGAEQIVTGNKLDLKEVAEGTYKFTIRADKYTTITDQSKALSCADPTLIFKMDPTGEDIVPAAMELTAIDQKGSVSVAKNTPFTVKVTGANPGEVVDIKNISTTPDTTLATGNADVSGFYSTTLTFDTDTTFDIQALQGCGVLVCTKNSNIISLKVGAGAKECLVPNPLGGCLLYKETAVGAGMFLLAALFGVAALGMVIMRAPAGGERIVVTAPAYPGGPPQTTVRETTQTVLGKATEKGIETLRTAALVAK